MKKCKLFCAAVLLLCTFLLTACAKQPLKLTYDGDAYRNSKTGDVFLNAPVCYRALSAVGDRETAKIVMKKGKDIPLYAIGELSAKLWLTDDSYLVYYQSSLELPTLREMQVYRISLCQADRYVSTLGVIESKAEIEDVIDLYERVSAVPASGIIRMPSSGYELLFSSAAYPGLAYSLELWVYESEAQIHLPLTESGEVPSLYPGIPVTVEEIVPGERVAVFHLGDKLVHNRSTGLCYPIGGVLEEYFTN